MLKKLDNMPFVVGRFTSFYPEIEFSKSYCSGATLLYHYGIVHPVE